LLGRCWSAAPAGEEPAEVAVVLPSTGHGDSTRRGEPARLLRLGRELGLPAASEVQLIDFGRKIVCGGRGAARSTRWCRRHAGQAGVDFSGPGQCCGTRPSPAARRRQWRSLDRRSPAETKRDALLSARRAP